MSDRQEDRASAPRRVRRMRGGGRLERGMVGWFILAVFGGASVFGDVTGAASFSGLDGLIWIPFHLAAIVGLVLGLRGIWSLGAPEVEVRLDPAEPILGEDLEVSWEIPGPVDGIKSLEISLSAVRIREPNSDHYHEQKLGRHRLAFARGEGVKRGAATFTMPFRAQPTTDGKAERITWTLQVRARVDGRPDARDRYTVRVLE